MTLRITFCGTNFQLCDRLARETREMLYGAASDVIELTSPIKEVMDRTRRERFDRHELDWFNMWAMAIHRMDMDQARESEVVISSSCGIDQLALQATWLTEQMEAEQTNLVITDATGQVGFSENQAYVNRSGSVVQVLLNSAEEELAEYWDFAYSVMPVAAKMSTTPSAVVFQYSDFLSEVPAFSGVKSLPDNFDAAVDALKNEVPLWKAKLVASS